MFSLALVASACGDGDGGGGSDDAEGKPVKGGTLVLGAEQEPDCADWIASCAGSSWGTFTMAAHTMPRAFDLTPDGKQVPSALLDGEPKLDEGPPMKVTYKIKQEAVWSDGKPITSADFKYTWEQIKNGTDIYDQTGYRDIASIDDSQPKTAVVTFSKPFAAWRDLFGGFFGVYPKHLLPATEKERNAAMKDGYTWSGGPWKIDHWTKDQEVVLVPNTNYWGAKPNLDKVVFRFFDDSAAELSAFKTNQVAMIYPQAQEELVDLFSLPGAKNDVVTSLSYEAIWFNTSKPPLDDKNVRMALAHATDRDAIVKTLFSRVQPGIQPIHAFMTQGNKEFYTSEPFKRYNRDLTKVDELLKASNYTKGPDGMYSKGGQPLQLEIATTAGNKRRERTQELLISQWKEAGIGLKANNTTPATLFGKWGPEGNFQIALFAQVPASTDPGICTTFCSENIPTPQKTTGNNWTRTNNPAVDKAWREVDAELNDDDRKELVEQGQKALADYVPGVPIDPFPDVILYHSAKIRGPIKHNFAYGPFANMNEWWCDKGVC